MKSTFILPLLIFLTGAANAQTAKDLFFSEFISNGYTNVLEIFNPTNDTIDLSVYSIRRNGNNSFRFDFPGGVLLPRKTWVGTRHEPANPPDPAVLAVADTGWSASGSIWFFGNNHMIELLKNNVIIDRINGDPRNATVAGIEGALDKRTLIRKPFIYKGETDWDISRGTNEDNAQWIVSPVSYNDLKKHLFFSPDDAVIWSDWYEVSDNGTGKDTIYFVPIEITGGELLNRVRTIPGASLELYRKTGEPIIPAEWIEPYDELLVWNIERTKSHTYVVLSGNYNYLKESVIISEVLFAEMLRAIEICNTTSRSVNLTGWGIGKNNAGITGGVEDFTAFPNGLTLNPGETFVTGYIFDKSTAVPSSSVSTFAEFAVPYFNMFEKGAANLNVLSKINSATSFTLRDNNNQIIDRFQPGGENSTIDGVKVAFNMSSLVRRPYVNHGEPDWKAGKEADKNSSSWTWRSHTYLELGQHVYYTSDTAYARSDVYQVSEGALQDSIFPLQAGITVAEFMENIQTQSVWATRVKKDGTVYRGEDVVPPGAVLEVISTDLSFVKTYHLSFGRSDLQLVSPVMEITGDTILCYGLYATSMDLHDRLEAPEGGSLQIVNGLGNPRSGYIMQGDRVLVTAEDFSRKYYYIAFDFSPTYTLIRSPLYPVDTLMNIISGVPAGENPNLFMSNIIFPGGLEISLMDNEGSWPDVISSGDVLRVKAGDGTEKDYIIHTVNITSTKQVWAEPAKTTMPPLTKRSDVYIRSLRPRTLTSFPGPINPETGAPWTTMDALYGFHCTQLKWVPSLMGTIGTGFINMVQDNGFVFQGSFNPRGNLLAGDNFFEPAKGQEGDQCCPNKPGTAREYFSAIRHFLNEGSEGLTFQSDGARWLMDGDVSTTLVCYCSYCDAKRASLGISNPASLAGKNFMLQSMLSLLDSVQTHFEDSLGHRIEWSGNNGSANSLNDMISLGYTMPYGEVTATEKWSTPAKWIDDMRQAERLGKLMTFQICSKEIDNNSRSDDVLNVNQYSKFVCINRAHFAFIYAAGGLASIPWDSYTATDQTRHFGLLSEFADLAGFIRGIGLLLDGYESGFDYFRANGPQVGLSYSDPRFSSQEAPIGVEGNDHAVVFVRVKPEDEEAPILLHLTEWFHIYEPDAYYEPYKFSTRNAYTLKLRRSAFFNGAPFSVKLLTPATYSRSSHEMSRAYSDELWVPGTCRGVNETAAYQNLVREEYLDFTIDGDFVFVQVPVLPHYGVLKLEKGQSGPSVLSSIKYQLCGNLLYVPEQVTVSGLLSGLRASGFTTMFVQDSLGFNKYSGQVERGDRLAVLSEDQSCQVYFISTGVEPLALTIKQDNQLIPPGTQIPAGEISVHGKKTWEFTLVNDYSHPIDISSISVDLIGMQVESTITTLAPGDSGVFRVKADQPAKGKNRATVKVSPVECGQLPLHFEIHYEGIAPVIMVRHSYEELTNRSVINLGTGSPGTILKAEITVMNYGRGELKVHETGSVHENVTVPSGELTLLHLEREVAEVEVLITELHQKEYSFYIHSNSYSPDSMITITLLVEGVAPLIKVMEGDKAVLPGDTLDFGIILQSGNIQLTLINEGNIFLDITSIVNESNRLNLSPGSTVVSPGSSRALDILYTPQSTGEWLDSILIRSNSYMESDFNIYFTGTALINSAGPENPMQIAGIYPNPFSDKLYLENIREFDLLKVVDNSGKTLYIQDLNQSDSYVLSAGSLGEGLYSIVLIGKGRMEVVKVVKR